MKALLKNIKRSLLLFIYLSASQNLAQQDPMLSLYMVDKVLINPAYAGSSNWINGTLKYRQQFYTTGKPGTQTFNFHGPIQSKHLGLGLKIINDNYALTMNQNIGAQISYHLNLLGGKLSAGIEGGVYNRKWRYDKLVADKKGDPNLNNNRQVLVPDLSCGLYYQKKQHYIGLAGYHISRSLFSKRSGGSAHLYSYTTFLAGTVIDLNKNWSVEPSLFIKYQKALKPQVDLNATVFFKEKFGAGIQYRTGDAIVFLIRLLPTENLRFSYAYDLTVSSLSKHSGGAHEIVISYGIKLPPPPTQKIIHPRYYF
jgi:type IX secretion system PorP/SprF family membrane protein